MSKITEAQAILAALQLPTAQQTEMAALTLLVLAQLDEDTPWSDAKRQSLRIHDMMQEMNSRYENIFERTSIEMTSGYHIGFLTSRRTLVVI